MSNPSRVIKGLDEGEGPFSQMSVEPVLIGSRGEVQRPASSSAATTRDGKEYKTVDLPVGAEARAPLMDSGSAHNLAEARQQASAILELARQGAEDLKAEALAYSAQIRAAAEAEAEERRSAAELEVSARLTQEYAEQYREAIHALADAAVEMKHRRDQYLSGIEEPAYELVLALGRRLLNDAWGRDSTLRSVLREALSLLRPEGSVRLYLHPATLDRAREDGGLVEVLRGSGLGQGELELLADEDLPRAAYRLDTGAAAVSFDLDEALQELMRRLRRQLPGCSELQARDPAKGGAAGVAPDSAEGLLPDSPLLEGRP